MEEEIKKIEEKLAECQKQSEEYLNGWKRAKADFINLKKDEDKRFEEVMKYGNSELVKELIDVLDSFDLATDLPKGALLIRQQIEEILKKQGLERIPIQIVSSGGIAQQADPNFHEVIEEIESTEPPNTILEEIVKGYTLYGRVVRPTKIKVAKEK